MNAVVYVPQEDADLDNLFQQAVAGITGLPANNVRPRWQTVPPDQPAPSVNWCAIGVAAITATYSPSITALPPTVADGVQTDFGSVIYIVHESIDVLASFYGPAAQQYAGYLRDGVALPPNMEALESVGIAWVDCGAITTMSELVNQQFLRRVDMPLYFRRKVTRQYLVPNIVFNEIDLIDDTGHVNRVIPVPPSTPTS